MVAERLAHTLLRMMVEDLGLQPGSTAAIKDIAPLWSAGATASQLSEAVTFALDRGYVRPTSAKRPVTLLLTARGWKAAREGAP